MFPRFPELPAEIRQLIWTFCLPELTPHLFEYKKGFWQFRELLPEERETPDHRTVFEFRLDLLDSVQIQSSLPQVNIEAYTMAIRWARHNHVQVNVSAPGLPLSIVLSHRFRHELDILYVPLADIDDFTYEASWWMFDDERIAQQDASSSRVPYFQNLAAPLESWQSDDPGTGFANELGMNYPDLETITAVVGGSTDDIGSRLDGFPNIRHGWSLVQCSQENPSDDQDLNKFQKYQTNAQKWWVANNKHPKQLQFCACRRS